jgi:transposase
MERREELLRQLREDPLALVDRLLELEGENAELEARKAELEAENAEMKRQLFGAKADKLSAEQEQQMAEVVGDLTEQVQRPPPVSAEILEEEKPAKPRHRRLRHPIPTELETVTTILEPAAEEKVCPRCGPKRCIGEERSERINLIPARLVREVTVRPKYACNCGQCGVAIAPLPASLIAQSRLGLGLAVFILLLRFDDHVAYYSLEKIFRERHRVLIARQQMVQWVEQMALLLLGIYHAMWAEMKVGGYLQIDETPVKVLDPEVKGKAATGYLWFYSVPQGDVIVEFCSGRGQQGPKARLEGFQGRIQSDAYDVYSCVERDLPGIARHGCLAHSRRKFYQALKEGQAEGIWFIGQIRKLYRIEDQAREQALSWEQRHALRQEHNAQAIWEAMKDKAEELKPKLLPKSTLGKAVNYFLNEYQPLTRYLEGGQYEIDNNLVENAIRPSCVGKKRWLFLGHPDAGWRSAVIYSIIISCRRHGINPQDYLTDVLGRLPSMIASEVKELVPSRWKPKPPNTGCAARPDGLHLP